MSTQAAKVIDLQAYRSARMAREARPADPAAAPMAGYAVPMVWCPMWVMVPSPLLMGAFYR